MVSSQIHGARAMPVMIWDGLAQSASLSATAVDGVERGVSDPRSSRSAAIQRVLEPAGVTSLAGNGDGPGVRPRAGIGKDGQG